MKNRNFPNFGVCTKQIIPLCAQSFVSGQIYRFYSVKRLTLVAIRSFRVKWRHFGQGVIINILVSLITTFTNYL